MKNIVWKKYVIDNFLNKMYTTCRLIMYKHMQKLFGCSHFSGSNMFIFIITFFYNYTSPFQFVSNSSTAEINIMY